VTASNCRLEAPRAHPPLGRTEILTTAVETDVITKLVAGKAQEILPAWADLLKKAGALETGRVNESELTVERRGFLGLFRDAVAKGGVDVANPAYTQVRDFLGDLSRSCALQGFSPRETAVFAFSLQSLCSRH
jgi:rsbT co-antagonist protein RsbR